MAYVPQQPELPPDMTVGQYVLLGRTPHIGYFGFETPRTDRTVCGELLDSLDLVAMARTSTLDACRVESCSGSSSPAPWRSRRRFSSSTSPPARSTSDVGSRRSSSSTRLRHERGLTVLSALHDLTLAGQFADRLILLGEGRAVSTGKPDEVLTEEALARHFGASVRVMRSEDGDLVVVPQRRR